MLERLPDVWETVNLIILITVNLIILITMAWVNIIIV